MNGMLDWLRHLLRRLAALERILVATLILFIVANIGAQVFSRYVLGKPLIWVEEAATYSFIWATFLGAALAMKSERHVRIASFVSRLAPAARALARCGVYLSILLLALVLMRQAWTVIGIESMRTSVALPLRLPVSLFFSLPLFVGMASIALTTIYLSAQEIRALVTGQARQPILPADSD